MFQFHTIEEALEDLRNGKIILATDDPDRENEGDFICAAEFATTENINFMATHGKGLICMPMSKAYVQKLQFPQMVTQNTDNHETAFTVSIDHVSTTTGISAAERSITAMKCVEEDAKPEDFRRPGHMFPLLARKNGVLEREGHTEATVDLMRLAGLKECGLCCEIMREDGTMMRTPELIELAQKWGIKFITIKDLQNYRKQHEKLVERVTVTKMPTKNADQIWGISGLRLCQPAKRRTSHRTRKRRDRRWRKRSLPCTFRVPHRRYFWLPSLRLRSAVCRCHDPD